ncbi:DUF2079 domain-containing protein [Synechococcus sp. RSCCF101]|uniref:DUF2079 domain-containing protein n=1 Tax=Synechococcus sp. RSCCF101 TaxID=2511069 RepID=UPI00124553B7|nr:DUF2079 domain-containing protein [Synechococcus sp. RSCCF101]QEY32899.1 DUF2079 domain-containing protein [Synechococcus sp. RSCCF101]
MRDPATGTGLERQRERRRVWLVAALFAITALALHWWRLQVLTASYDQGIFLQVLWNTARGHWFESTLSSQLSTPVVHDGALPVLGYRRLGQHFTPMLALWAPLVALLGAWALPLVQVGLITGAGLVLHRLAEILLAPVLARLVAWSYFGANALIGPTLGNFTDLCQLPLAFFALMLGLRQQRTWLIAIAALVIPLIREDTGVLLVAVAIWMLVRQRERWRLALLLALYGGGWVLLCTTVLMPLFSEDSSRRFMVENFGQYLGERDQASSLEVLGHVLAQPVLVLRELVSPPLQTLLYLLGQSLPLALVPLVSIDSWLLAGPSLLGLFLAQGDNDPLSINIRYTLLVVPGLFSGTVFWWHRRGGRVPARRWRSLWLGCIVLSLLFTLTSNPNRSLSFLIPDSIQPWVYSSPARQWQHGRAAQRALAVIPPDASVSANTPLVPWLAQRPALVRFPRGHRYRDRQGIEREVDWIAVDLGWLRHYGRAFPSDRRKLERAIRTLVELSDRYRPLRVEDGVVVLQHRRHPPDDAEAGQADADLKRLLSRLQAEV